MKNGKSWKTTVFGVATLLGGLSVIGGMITGNVELKAETVIAVITAITGGIGLIFGKDSNVTGAGPGATTVK